MALWLDMPRGDTLDVYSCATNIGELFIVESSIAETIMGYCLCVRQGQGFL